MAGTTSDVAAAPRLAQHLRLRGAVYDGEHIAHFGDIAGERVALAADTTLHAWDDHALLEVSGADAASFLQGQLTSDVAGLPQYSAQVSSYCTPQGRVLAILIVWRTADGYLLQLPRELVHGIRSRLQKFVLRARVRLDDASERFALLGIGGPGAAQAVAAAFGAAPAAELALVHRDSGMALQLRDALFACAVPESDAPAAWDALTQQARPAGTAGWHWRLIQAGIPFVTSATAEAFVPQMLNLERLGAVSFSKGCYPGQEIVARTQYRGDAKRRLFRLHAQAPNADPGAGIFAPDRAQAVGTVLDAAPAPAGGTDVLAVLSLEAAAHADLRLGARTGPPVSAAQPA